MLLSLLEFLNSLFEGFEKRHKNTRPIGLGKLYDEEFNIDKFSADQMLNLLFEKNAELSIRTHLPKKTVLPSDSGLCSGGG